MLPFQFRAGWPNGFPSELFRYPVQHWDFWLRIRETLNQLRERYEAQKARRRAALKAMAEAREAEQARLASMETTKASNVKKMDEEDSEDIFGSEFDDLDAVKEEPKVHFLRNSKRSSFRQALGPW